MDFFSSQDSLTIIQWSVRAVISFTFLLIATKIMGPRSFSQLRLLDFIIALIIGNIIAHPLSDEHLGMKGSMVTITVLVIFYTLCVYLSLKWDKFRTWLDPSPFPIIKNGQIIYKNLAKARIPIDVLLSELRKDKIEDIQKISLALWEPDGTLSTFLHSQHQPLTPLDIQVKTKPFSLPNLIIKEGKINYTELDKRGKDEVWLKKNLELTYQTSVSDILLATIDIDEKITVYLYT